MTGITPHSPLKAIVYLSASARPMSGLLLEHLLVEARRLNLESGVTGTLIYSDGTFMQYFEGEDRAMAETWGRIRQSRQHSRIVEVMNEPIDKRAFPDWQMALAQPASSDLLALSTASWVVQNAASIATRRDSVGMTLLRNFWKRRGSSG